MSSYKSNFWSPHTNNLQYLPVPPNKPDWQKQQTRWSPLGRIMLIVSAKHNRPLPRLHTLHSPEMCSAPGKSWMQLPLPLSPYSHTPVSLLEKETGRFNKIWGCRQAAVFLQRWTVCLKMIHTQPLGREKANTEAVWKAKPDLIQLWHVRKRLH